MRVNRVGGAGGRALALLAAAVLVALPACDSDGEAKRKTDGRSTFTGEPAVPRPVLAVKIDNVAPARPQTGVDRADVVYVERVEAGLSRILAIFSSDLPPLVGPVRSARESDLDLLRQFGRPALAYSGVQSKLQPVIDGAPLFPVTPGRAPDAFLRSPDRAAPHNLYVRPAAALRAAPDASDAKDIGFHFGAAPASGGEPVRQETVRYPAARFGFSWSGEQKRWLVSMDGTPAATTDGKRLSAATVVIQHVDIRDSRFRDRLGSVSPFTETTGSGTAEVLRDGKSYPARWVRPDAEDGTEFTTPDGDELNFARGQVWVVYAPR
ncbi:DUF3048 domain-containing protein [Streptomyces sp. XD-27]|uniref:DUF3048 domain-containing protein n=1 Tax=Streptomyces sp. XD-27 TaxID=3062779 RepID=UPI0026F44B12|nr:DUF3048 domain-containing protein [Streptomyces sp. XD-27]WKX68813.1 DUF3048 domain-containing protein [Streptomyces sp. XD-27]